MTNVVIMRAPIQFGERKIFEKIQTLASELTGDISVHDYLQGRASAVAEISELLEQLQQGMKAKRQHGHEQEDVHFHGRA